MNLTVKFLLAMIAFSSPAFAWKETGGGDEVALDFQRAFTSAINSVEKGAVSGPFTVADLKKVATDARILVVDERLLITLSGITQDSIAVNTPSQSLIRINRSRWTNLKDARLKEAVALHEVLSLRKIESTGDYSYSARYLEAFGLSPWLVSGAQAGTVPRPRPKLLSCKGYYNFDAMKNTAVEHLSFEQMTNENDGTPDSLSVRKTLTSKDGRIDIYLWAVQPFQNPYLPFPREMTSISIVDKKKKISSGAGPSMWAEAEEDMRPSKAQYMTFADDALTTPEVLVNMDCNLK